ncbi:probable folate-biopterin transporter 7 [Cryptomeria japonica]|uniref:probable folate-biopterin transporter 7 n=1 Tax=Cryptomeria japonica TaxID=3369 RepID=UPI0027DA6FD9|nr:probable folate-biopterin transporter 7 [Cryptomeria japonica]
MPGWCRVGSQGATIPLLNTPHHHSTPHKDTHVPLTSVPFKPKQTQNLSISYCFNANKDFHIRKPLLRTAHIPNPQSKLSRVRTEYTDKLRKFASIPYLEFARRRREILLLSSGGWLWRMRRNYGSDLLVLLAVGYCIQGFRGFPWLAMNFYLKDKLMVNPGTLQFLLNTVNLPMVAKPLYGIFSDAVYIGGAHRLPYIVLGGLLQAVSWGSIAFIPAAGSSIAIMAAFLILSNLGASIVEVATDALVAECGKKHKVDSSGELQSFAWMALTAGSVLGNLFGGIFVSQVDAKTMFNVFVLLLTMQVGTSLIVREESFGLASVRATKIAECPNPIQTKLHRFSSLKNSITDVSTNNVIGLGWRGSSMVTSFTRKLSDIVEIVKKPEIAYPLVFFAASYAMIPLLTGTMFFYQTQYLKIDPSIFGLAKVVGQMGLMLGSIFYNRLLKKVPFRKLVCSVQILLSVCMLSDIILVKQLNIQLGIPNEIFIFGASAFVEAVAQFKVLPFTVHFAQLCPAGCEGSLMSLVMSTHCLASIMSGYLGIALVSFLGVSSENYSRLPLGILIQSMATLVPLVWISFIPDTKPASERCRT